MSIVTRILPLVVLAPLSSCPHSQFNSVEASDAGCIESLVHLSSLCPYARRNCSFMKQLQSLSEKPASDEDAPTLDRARTLLTKAFLNLYQALGTLKAAHIKAKMDRMEADASMTSPAPTEKMPESKWGPKLDELLSALEAAPSSPDKIVSDDTTPASSLLKDIDDVFPTNDIDWDKVKGVEMEVDGVHKWLELSDDQKNDLKGANRSELTDKLIQAYEQAQGLTPSSARDYTDIAYTIKY